MFWGEILPVGLRISRTDEGDQRSDSTVFHGILILSVRGSDHDLIPCSYEVNILHILQAYGLPLLQDRIFNYFIVAR